MDFFDNLGKKITDAGEAVYQLGLAVSVDAGDTDDFTPPDFERNIFDGVVVMSF